MNNKELKRDDHFEKLILSAGIEKVDDNFADSVMDKIEQLEPNVQTSHDIRVMSAWGWVIAVSITLILVFSAVVLGTPSNYFESITSIFDKFRFEFNFVQIPNTFLISIIGFIFFFFVQIRLYMHSLSRFHKRN